MDKYISLKDCLRELNKYSYSLPIILGKDINNNIHTKDLKELKNMLISGSTSSGKSVFLNSIINTILLTKTPKEVQLILIDFKRAEFHTYEDIPHLKYPVIYDVEEAVYKLAEIYTEREENKDKSYPDIVILLEDYADFLSLERIRSNVFQDLRRTIIRILTMGHTLGIYTILSSSKVSDNQLLERIRESIPNRLVGFLPTSQDSIAMLGEQGAEKLEGRGDMFFKNMDTNEKVRVQAPFISTDETENIVQRISRKKQVEMLRDVLYEDAKRAVIESGNATASYLQRHFKIGYNQAARLIDQLELNGIIGPKEGVKKRKIFLEKYEQPIEEEIKSEDNYKQEKLKPYGDILWLTKEKVKGALHMEEELPIKEIKLLPFLQEDIHYPDLSPFALIAGILKMYDIENSEMVEAVYGLDISKQKKWYKKFLLTIGQEKPNEEFTEGLILATLVRIANQYGNDFVIPLYKNAIQLFPTSKIFCDYISTMMNYLYDNPKERNEKIYKELQDIFKKIKKEEVEPRIWESMVLTNYCLTDLLGNDKSKAPYLSDIKQENKLKAIKERSCFNILFGEEYI
ncbi:MAG: FtsK/SpoIIIE domain-containing protein [Candidatus Dojkabacteria bacterium]|jgi:hypothetical protein|nr:FtsK/SpoIIIE domain-containing protein [Candidatus Dojkabacteria bacterium]